MLCPDCRLAGPGGTPCPRCGQPIPERESFGGQGAHYLRVLAGVSVVLAAIFALSISRGPGFQATLHRLHQSGWIWLILLVLCIPLGVGLYYWSILRDEEIIVNDERIVRRSRWGDESLAWADVQAFCHRPVLFRQTRLGRIAGLSQFFRKRAFILKRPPMGYELVGRPDAAGRVPCMVLEPGTIDDMDWLLELIKERVGPPEEA